MIKQQDLIKGIQCGDRKVIAGFYRNYRTIFFAWASSEHSIGKETVAEIYQDAIMVVIKHIVDGQLEAFTHSPWHYLKRVGQNLIRNAIRKKQKEQLVFDSISIENDVLPTNISEQGYDSLLVLIRQCVDQMDMPCKRIIELFYYRKYVIEAIKREMNYKDEAVVRNQKRRCLQYLFRQIKALEND